MSKELDGTLLSEEKYRSATIDGRLEFDEDSIRKDLYAASSNPPIIFESCFMLSILKALIFNNKSITIYIKTLSSSTNQWTDEDELELEASKIQALEKEVKFGKQFGIAPSNFRLQMIEYHYNYKPHEKSDVIFERIE